VYEEVFGCGFALVGQNLIMQIKDSGRDNVSNTTRSPPCPPAIRICRRSGGSCKPEWRWQKAICTVRARRFKTPSRLLIDLKFCSQPGKPLRLHRRYASTQKKSKPPKRIATAPSFAFQRLPIPSNRTSHFAQLSSPQLPYAESCVKES
jgi:hypothetical protein